MNTLRIETLFRPTPLSAWFIIFPSVYAAMLYCIFLTACSKNVELNETAQTLQFKTLGGSKIALSEITGPTLVNFWSTNCVVCVREMPHMAEFYRELAPKGFELIAVAMSYAPPNEVLQLNEEFDLPFPVALDLNGEAEDAFASVKGTPTSYLIDKHGNLVERYIGALDLAKLRVTVNNLLEAN